MRDDYWIGTLSRATGWPFVGAIHTLSRLTNISFTTGYRHSNLAILGFFLVLAIPSLKEARAQCVPITPMYRSVQQVQSLTRANTSQTMPTLQNASLAYLAPHRFAFQLRHNSEADRTGTLHNDGWRQSTGDQSEWSWRLDMEWDFSRLIHNPAKLSQARVMLEISKRIEHAIDSATRLYFEKLELMKIAETAPQERCRRLHHQIQLLDARLSVLTGKKELTAGKLEVLPSGPYTRRNVD